MADEAWTNADWERSGIAEPVIRLHSFQPSILTVEEWERLEREVWSRTVAGDTGVSDRVLTRMLRDNLDRYHFCCAAMGKTPQQLMIPKPLSAKE